MPQYPTEPKLDARLAMAAEFVRPDAVFADIGTDHAYLPIALLQRGVIRRAVAADIAKAPLETARAHLDACAAIDPTLYEKIDLVLTDGLAGLDSYTPRITDIAICGMGGELIARILSDAPFVFHPDIRLILQPMTMQPYLRTWLFGACFEIETERLCKTQNGKLYSVICCHYTGVESASHDAFFGAELLRDEKNIPLLGEYLRAKSETLDRIIRGKTAAGVDCTVEKRDFNKAQNILAALQKPVWSL